MFVYARNQIYLQSSNNFKTKDIFPLDPAAAIWRGKEAHLFLPLVNFTPHHLFDALMSKERTHLNWITHHLGDIYFCGARSGHC